MFQLGLFAASDTFSQSFEDIIMVSRDVSSITSRTYVPLPVLQAAHWSQSLLRNQITAKPSSSSSRVSPPASPPPYRDKELGLAVTTADIFATLSSTNGQLDGNEEEGKAFYPIPADSSLRLGESGIIERTSMDQLFELSTYITDHKRGDRLTTSESNFFGLIGDRQIASSCIIADPSGRSQWSPYPPFRFAVEFWDIGSLKEKCRLHSHTIWYAGSLFNVYVQVVRKKGVQLGVYLHRQSSVDPIPPPSAPSLARAERARNWSSSVSPNIVSSFSAPSVHYSPSIHPPSRSSTPISSAVPLTTQYASYALGANSIPATGAPVMPSQPYRDPRSPITLYFTISCASATGSSLTRFSSAPDVFSVSQSWGWKSSSLMTDEYSDIGPEEILITPVVSAGREVSLRATVTLGLV